MNKHAALIIVLALTAMASCYDIADDTPACLRDQIKTFRKSGACEDRSVGEYRFQGRIVYVFLSGTCGADMGADVLDVECAKMGFLGGIAGNTEINGGDFSKAEFIRTVWKK